MAVQPLDSNLDRSRGYVALISVLAVVAIGSIIGVSLLQLGLGASRTSFAMQQSNQAKGLANACAEEALQQIRNNTAFTGTNNLSLGQGSCTYTVTAGAGENRTIDATGTVSTIKRKLQISITAINPKIIVLSWEEKDF